MQNDNMSSDDGGRTVNESSQAPLTADELAQREASGGSLEPRRESGNRQEVLVSGPSAQEPKVEIHPRPAGWSLKLPEGFTWGLVASKGQDLSVADLHQTVSSSTRWYRSDSTKVVARPKSLGAPAPQITRRKNGRRVRLDGVIFNSDDRQVFDPANDYPWRCVGLLMVWNDPNSFFWDPPTGTGTVALVGPNFVLTASHMIPDQDRWKGIFLPGFFDGRTSFGQFSYIETWRRYNPHDQGDDLAVLKLFEPIGEQLGWFGTKVYDDDWEDGNFLTKVGYPGMLANGRRPSFTGPFPIIDDDGSYGLELEYRADASPGDSGGPVWAVWDDGPYIVGAHSGGEEEFEINWPNLFTVLNNVAAGGPALTDLVSWGHTNW